MNRSESLDQLEATHSFPCKFLFKVIGRTGEDFAGSVVAVIRRSLNQEFDPPYEVRETPSGRHVSVSIEPWVESAEQVLTAYARIRDLPGLVMMM